MLQRNIMRPLLLALAVAAGGATLSCGRAGDAAPSAGPQSPRTTSADPAPAQPGGYDAPKAEEAPAFELSGESGAAGAVAPPPPDVPEPTSDSEVEGDSRWRQLSQRAGNKPMTGTPKGSETVDLPALDPANRLLGVTNGKPDDSGGDDAFAPAKTADGTSRDDEARLLDSVEDRDGEPDEPADEVALAMRTELKKAVKEKNLAKREREETESEEQQDLAGTLDVGRLKVKLTQYREDALTYVPPATLLPRMFYFENTYLGGSAAYRERLIRLDAALREGERPYRLAYGAQQPFDPPATSGLEVTAELDAPYFDQPRRVFLQVGLRGSPRYGWRRPPLDVVLVVDGPALTQAPDAVVEMVVELLAKLGPADRLGIVVAGDEPQVFTDLARLERARGRLAATLDQLPATTPRRYGPGALGRAIARAGEILADASADTAIVPGTETVLVVTAGNDQASVASATAAAHALTIQGAVTSVFALDRSPERGGWWQVANAGHGNYHHLGDASTAELVGWELESLARVVARLVRVNIRLGKTAGAIRVLGTRVLDKEEVAQVKAREEATDQNLSRAMGITSDRGEDDDGIQTVIPYFYGDDSHVILVELWVDGAGPIADITVKYKDMVNLGNATARTSVRIDSLPRSETPESDMIAKNVAGFELAEALQRASHRVKHGDPAGAAAQLSVARRKATLTGARDARVVEGFEDIVNDDQTWTWDANRRAAVSASLELAGERRVGESGP